MASTSSSSSSYKFDKETLETIKIVVDEVTAHHDVEMKKDWFKELIKKTQKAA